MPKRRPNNDGSIGRYKNGWRGQYTDPVTHQQRPVYGKTQAECKRKLDAKLTEIRSGSYVAPDKITVRAWLDTWFDTFYRRTVKASTAATTKGNIDKLSAALGDYSLQKLSALHIQRFISKELDAGRKVSTVRRYLKALRQALEQARDTGKINHDPLRGIKLPTMEKVEIQFLSHAEQKAFFAACPSTTNGRALRFLLLTGMRVSELCGLQWQDIQADGLHIERSNMTIKDLQEDGYTNITTLPKTQAGKRIIPLTPQLRQLLEEQRIMQLRERLKAGNAWTGGNAGKDSAFIFANRIGNPSDRNNLNRVYRGILKKIGIPSRGVHTLRHTFATNWIQQSPDIVALARVLGHSDPSFTYRTYCHADQRSINQGMTMMEAFFANVK